MHRNTCNRCLENTTSAQREMEDLRMRFEDAFDHEGIVLCDKAINVIEELKTLIYSRHIRGKSD